MEENIDISLSNIIDDSFDSHFLQIKTNLINNNTIFCCNCGKYGHIYKKCLEPIISIGIINLYISDINIDLFFKNLYVYNINHYQNTNVGIYKLNNNISDINITSYLNIVKEKTKFLMVRRRNTIGYIEFIRGRYNINNINSIINLFNQMITEEIEFIKNNNFDNIWNDLWGDKYYNLPIDYTTFNKQMSSNNIELQHNLNKLSPKDKTFYISVHLKDYSVSKIKFEIFTKQKILNKISNKLDIKYNQAEWGFPKGRRNIYESNLDCAIREFNEETNLDINNINIMNRIYPIHEDLIGTNNIKYRHNYFLSFSELFNLDIKASNQKLEIGDIGWFNYIEAKSLIRPYHINRLKILDNIIHFIAYNLKYYTENKLI